MVLVQSQFPCWWNSHVSWVLSLPAGEITFFFFDDDRLLLMKVTSNLWQKRAYNSYMTIVAPTNKSPLLDGDGGVAVAQSRAEKAPFDMWQTPRGTSPNNSWFPCSIPGLQFTDHDTCIHVIYIYIYNLGKIDKVLDYIPIIWPCVDGQSPCVYIYIYTFVCVCVERERDIYSKPQ